MNNDNKVGVNRYQVNWIDVNSIHEDKNNPNAMDEHEFNALVREVSIHGIIQPIITRPCTCDLIKGEHRCIVGGEHRWRAARQLRMNEVPCIDLSINDIQAKILMVNLNSIHGRVIPLKLANLIVDLNRSIPMEEIRSRLYLSKDCLESIAKRRVTDDPYDKLLTMNGDSKIARESARRVVDGGICKDTNQSNAHGTIVNHDTGSVKIKTLSITLSKQQYDEIVYVLDDIALRYRCTRGDALLILCRMYYQDQKQQG
ncbi:MAG: ParB/RepB/Spo0J family partition protein [Candidatus Nitrosocaldus sp.]